MKRLLVAALCAPLLASCATPYQEIGLTGGVSATQIDETTLRISGRGNGFTEAATIQNYVLLKAAEETARRGYDLFLIVSASDASRIGSIVIPGSATSYTTGSATAYGYGNFATARGSSTTQTYYTPSQNIPFVKPGQDAVVKMFRGVKPSDAPPNLFVASDVIRYLGSQVGGRDYSPPIVAAARSDEEAPTPVTASLPARAAPTPVSESLPARAAPTPNASPRVASASPPNAARAKPELGVRGGTVERNQSGPATYLADPYGAWIDETIPDGPAAKAGIRRADIVRSFNGHRVETFEELEAYAAETTPGSKVRLGIFRNREMITIDVDL